MGLKPDHWIRKMAREHGMIEPFVDEQIREGVISYGVSSYGYDLRVANEFKNFHQRLQRGGGSQNFDPKSMVDFTGDVCIIPPNSFALARSVEYFRIPRGVLTICIGKSTYARCGIIVNVTPFQNRPGRGTSPSKSRTPRRCPPKSTPTKGWRRSCSLRPMKSVK